MKWNRGKQYANKHCYWCCGGVYYGFGSANTGSRHEVVMESGGQRAGIADGGELEICPPATAAWLFDKVKY